MLIRSLGARCEICGEETLSLLSIDHPEGCTFRHRALRYDARVHRYVKEFAEGVRLRVLCIPCNSSYRPGREPGDDLDSPPVFDHDLPEPPEAPF